MESARKVECSVHGWQLESFVCRHIVESLHTGQPVGFHWASDSASAHPDAWCSACEAARLEAGGEWTDSLIDDVLGVKLLCDACYERAKGIWVNGQKVDQ